MWVDQIPPTPTFIPQGTPMLDLPDVRIWDYADDAVGAWNLMRDYTPAVQYAVIGVLIIVGIITVIKLIRGLNNES